jgi:phosphatidylserine decarboxylase
MALITATTLFFFRDPSRSVLADDEVSVVAPADGKIVSVTEKEEPEFLSSRAVKISIFLSLLDVHVNRIPVSGSVEYTRYREGQFYAAFRSEASDKNERMAVGIETTTGVKVLVAQIAGYIARRIVCRAEKGRRYRCGERYGLICFGSRTDLFLPESARIQVKLGDRVRAGETIIGTLS